MRGGGVRARPAAALAALLLLLTAAAPAAVPAPAVLQAPAAPVAPRAAVGPTVAVDRAEAPKGGSVTVSGTGWRPGALLTLLLCGQNMIGGTNACANGDGRTVTAGADGTFRRSVPVVAPPRPCPCVLHVATVSGDPEAADAALAVTGHPVAVLPEEKGGERLRALSAGLEGSSGLLTWFGAPPARRLVVKVANLGAGPARNPVFRLGVARGVLAPSWEERPWRGTVAAGRTERVVVDVELAAGAYGEHLLSLEYGGKVLVEQRWDVARPWGVTLFWVLLCVVVPLAVFRAGMAVVDRVRSRTPVRPPAGASGAPGALPWFTPATDPRHAPSRRAREEQAREEGAR
ncbi:neocarzinostatin apoprotein domain-containing protein [Streptomyces sp. NPDC053048]|uniref:neocarzinostatin apoprotein domain-containing protein n=1 Tax=Streptomyces sp. NPDC053048 TaxID=3365694 RepID=UPI0037D455FF